MNVSQDPAPTAAAEEAPPSPRVIEDASADASPGSGPSQPRPRGIHTKHLTVLDRFRVRVLYYDAMLTKERIRRITGFSTSQVDTAVRAATASVGRRRGRPPNADPEKRGRCEWLFYLLGFPLFLLGLIIGFLRGKGGKGDWVKGMNDCMSE